jgi:hypothetical protein
VIICALCHAVLSGLLEIYPSFEQLRSLLAEKWRPHSNTADSECNSTNIRVSHPSRYTHNRENCYTHSAVLGSTSSCFGNLLHCWYPLRRGQRILSLHTGITPWRRDKGVGVRWCWAARWDRIYSQQNKSGRCAWTEKNKHRSLVVSPAQITPLY